MIQTNSLACGKLFLLACSLAAGNVLAQSPSHTPWQVHEGGKVLSFNTSGAAGPPEETFRNVFDEFKDLIPPQGHAGWKPAKVTDGKVDYTFDRMASCGSEVDFVYFQTEVTIPKGQTITDFEVSYEEANDAARVYFFPGNATVGKFDPSADLIRAVSNYKAVNLREDVMPGRNRIVIAAFNQCHGGKVQGIKLTLNGEEVKTAPATETADSGDTSCFLLKAVGVDGAAADQPHYVGYYENRVRPDGQTELRLAPMGADNFVPAHLVKVDVAEGTFALRVKNYSGPDEAAAGGKEPFLTSYDNGQLWIQYRTKDNSGRGHLVEEAPLDGGASAASFHSTFKNGWFLRNQKTYVKLHPANNASFNKSDATWVKEPCSGTSDDLVISAGKAFKMLAYSVHGGTDDEKRYGDTKHYVGYSPSAVTDEGRVPVLILEKTGPDSRFLEIVPVDAGPDTYAFKIINFQGSQSAGANGGSPYLVANGSEAHVQYLADNEVKDHSLFVSRPPLHQEADSEQFRSFESKAQPGLFLRHSGYIVFLHQSDGSTLFQQDATWRIEDSE